MHLHAENCESKDNDFPSLSVALCLEQPRNWVRIKGGCGYEAERMDGADVGIKRGYWGKMRISIYIVRFGEFVYTIGL